MFPDNLYISDPTDGRLYVVENDVVTRSMSVPKEARAILVCQNMADIYTVNRDDNTVTRIHNGETVGDIKVGNTPYGICEDINGRIYVTNYSDQTVTVIENGQVVGLPIPVSAGPRGIVADYYGNVWVACFLTNTVVKIVNRTVVDEIAVPYNPEGITCSPTNDIWVACSGSNVAVKITNGQKKLTIPTGKCPVAIVCDKKGNVFTANFEEDTITMIATSEENQTAEIRVGDGPSAIAVNTANLIYVTSNLSSEMVYKVNPGTQQVINRIHVCKSQCAFGDFTGCAAFNVFFPNGKDGMGTSISTQALNNVVQSLKPTFKITDIDEDGTNTKFTVASDLLDISTFSRMVLNGVEANDDGTFTLSSDQIGNDLQLVGYFNDDNSNPIPFSSIPYKSVFKAYIGLVDTAYNNFTMLKERVVDFSQKDMISAFAQQTTDGHLLALVPTRVFNEFKDGFMVQGNFNIGDNWKETVPATEVQVSSGDRVEEFTVDTNDTSEEGRTWDIDEASTRTYVLTSGSNTLIQGTDYRIEAVSDNITNIILENYDKIVDNKLIVTVKGSMTTTTVSGSQVLKNILNSTGWSSAKQAKFTALVNNYQTNAAEKWMFNFFNTLA